MTGLIDKVRLDHFTEEELRIWSKVPLNLPKLIHLLLAELDLRALKGGNY